jgi:perosamine synthetase
MSNLQAAVGLAQIEKADELLAKKAQINLWYREALSPLSKFIGPLGTTKNAKPNYWMIAYRLCNKKSHIQPLREYLAENGIETRTFFIPLHLQPVYHKGYHQGQFPQAEELCRTGILLPSGTGLTQKEIARIADCIKDFFRRKS